MLEIIPHPLADCKGTSIPTFDEGQTGTILPVRFRLLSFSFLGSTETPPRSAAVLRGIDVAHISSGTVTFRVGWLLMACVLIGPTGCVRRRMTIRTTPPGATVYVDEQPIGNTPVSADFTYYGVRTIRAFKDEHRTETIKHRFDPPWYQIPPFDFIAENLWPGEIRDEQVVDIQMVPEPPVTNNELRERGETLRSSAKTGQITPLVPPLTEGGSPPATQPLTSPGTADQPNSIPSRGRPFLRHH